MAPSPAQPESDPLQLSTDPVISFMPKAEDVAPELSPFEGIMSAASSAVSGQGIGNVVSALDPSPYAGAFAETSGEPTAQMQMQIDVLKSMSTAGASNVFLHDYPLAQQRQQQQQQQQQQRRQSLASMGMSEDMQGILPVREESPASIQTTSSNAASPAPAPYTNISTSSLASALDDPTASLLSRSRSGSLISPIANIQSNGVTRASPPVQSNESSLGFPSLSPEFASIPPPDPVNAPHMMVVDEFLTRIIKTASSARTACSMGQGAEAHAKIDDMRRQIALVSQLLASTGISSSPKGEIINGQVSLGSNGNAPQASGSGHTPSASLSGMEHAPHPGLIPNFSSVALAPLPSAPPSSFDLTGTSSSIDLLTSSTSLQHSPDSDSSRKRCASSMAGNRINKAIRLESKDGTGMPPLTQPATPPLHPGGGNQLPAMLSAQMLPPSHIPSPTAPLTVPVNAPLALGGPPMASLPLVNAGALSHSHASPSAPPSRSGSPKPPALTAAQPHPGWSAGPAPTPIAHPGLAQVQSGSGFTSLPLDIAAAVQADIVANGGLGNAMPSPSQAMPPSWPDVPSMNPNVIGGMGTVHPQDISGPAPGQSGMPFGTPAYVAMPPGPIPSGAAVLDAMNRASRSNSLTTPLHNPLVYGANAEQQQQQQPIHQPSEFVPSQAAGPAGRARAHSRVSASAGQRQRSPSSSSQEDDDSDYMTDSRPNNAYGQGALKSSPPPPGDNNGNGSRDSSRERERPPLRSRQNGSAEGGSHPGNEIPQEIREEVDRIFFEFLNKICSNLDAKDAKGELIHQTLMAKKMQRLDESPDFRPFKFRIQAFTNGFLEELARQGYPEEKLAMKKVRNYLWTQPYISRFNEDGKKAKSKGNHIWNIDAKKRQDGGWDYRPFHRKLAGSPPSVAYIGLRWSWTPRIWDPQASRPNLKVSYSSPNLPPWLVWEGSTLSGTPPPDAQSCDVTVEARVTFEQDQGEETLVNTFHINVSAVPSGNDLSFNAARPSLANDLYNPRRVHSDSVVPGVAGVIGRSMMPPAVATAQEVQMVQVFETAAQRVAQEAQAVVVGATHHVSPDSELQALAKQQHVLTVTAQALDQEVNVPPQSVSPSSHALAAAGSQVVMQAARHVVAELTAMSTAAHMARGMIPPPEVSPTTVTVNDVSVATQSAVAQAVELTGPLSSEVDVMMTAKSLLQQQTVPCPPVTLPPSALHPAPGASFEGARPHSTSILNSQYPPPMSQFPTSIATMTSNF